MIGVGFPFLSKSSGGGAPPASPPTVTSLSHGVVDPSGGGLPVSIYGADFVSGATVEFRQASVTYWSTSTTFVNSGELTFVPPVMGTGNQLDVVVVNPDAQEDGDGNGLLWVFAPHDLSPTLELLPGAYSVAGTQGVDAIGTWLDASGNGNHAVSVSGTDAPIESSDGTPVFDSLGNTINHYLQVAASLASAAGSPPDLAELAAGTQVACIKPTASSGAPAANYEDASIIVGDGASAGLCYNDDGIQWEAYDEVGTDYERTAAVAAAIGVRHFAAGRWSGSTWGSRANGSAWQNNTADASVLSDGNVGPNTQIGGGTYALGFDGELSAVLVFASALSDANVDMIRAWAQQRGIAA